MVVLAHATKLRLRWVTNTDARLATVTERRELLTSEWCWGELGMSEWGKRRTVGRVNACCCKGDAGLCSTVDVMWGARRNEGMSGKEEGWMGVGRTDGGGNAGEIS